MCSSKISRKYWFLIYNQSHDQAYCFVLKPINFLISLELIVQVEWGFRQNVALRMTNTIKYKSKHLQFSTSKTDFAWSHYMFKTAVFYKGIHTTVKKLYYKSLDASKPCASMLTDDSPGCVFLIYSKSGNFCTSFHFHAFCAKISKSEN